MVRLMVVAVLFGCSSSWTHMVLRCSPLLTYALHVAHICLKFMSQIKVEYLR